MTDEIGNKIFTAISSGDLAVALAAIKDLDTATRNPETGGSYVMWVTSPVNITALHAAIREKYNIDQRSLAIRRVKASRPMLASMLIRAMITALERASAR